MSKSTSPKAKSPPSFQLALDEQLCFAVYSTMLSINKAYRGLLKKLGLTYPQYLVMLVLWERDGLMVSEIGERLFLDSPTLTPLLKRLESSSLVVRERSSADERQVIVSLTEAGRRLRERAVGVPDCVATAMACAPGELEFLRGRLVDLRGRLLSNAA